MKRMLILFAAAMVVLGAASPALAQRDPFAPQEGSGAQDEPSDSGDENGAVDDPTVEPDDEDTSSPNRSDQLANTGANPEPWLVVAYGLFAAGVAALFVSKVYSPVDHRK